MEGPYFDKVPVCPSCGCVYFRPMLKCSCCMEYTPNACAVTDDGRIYCENCFHMEDPAYD